MCSVMHGPKLCGAAFLPSQKVLKVHRMKSQNCSKVQTSNKGMNKSGPAYTALAVNERLLKQPMAL